MGSRDRRRCRGMTTSNITSRNIRTTGSRTIRRRTRWVERRTTAMLRRREGTRERSNSSRCSMAARTAIKASRNSRCRCSSHSSKTKASSAVASRSVWSCKSEIYSRALHQEGMARKAGKVKASIPRKGRLYDALVCTLCYSTETSRPADSLLTVMDHRLCWPLLYCRHIQVRSCATYQYPSLIVRSGMPVAAPRDSARHCHTFWSST